MNHRVAELHLDLMSRPFDVTRKLNGTLRRFDTSYKLHATMHVTLHGRVTCIALDRTGGKSCTRIVDDTTSYTAARRSWDSDPFVTWSLHEVVSSRAVGLRKRVAAERGTPLLQARCDANARETVWVRLTAPERERRTANRARICMCMYARVCVWCAHMYVPCI